MATFRLQRGLGICDHVLEERKRRAEPAHNNAGLVGAPRRRPRLLPDPDDARDLFGILLRAAPVPPDRRVVDCSTCEKAEKIEPIEWSQLLSRSHSPCTGDQRPHAPCLLSTCRLAAPSTSEKRKLPDS